MNYNIINLIDKTCLDLLKTRIGKTIISNKKFVVNEYVCPIILCFDDDEYMVEGEPIFIGDDKNEYPKLAFTLVNYEYINVEFENEKTNDIIKKIKIIREKVKYHEDENNWQVIMDIGIVFELSTSKIIVTTTDNCVGLMKETTGPDINVDDLEVESWTYKTEKFDERIREIIDINDL